MGGLSDIPAPELVYHCVFTSNYARRMHSKRWTELFPTTNHGSRDFCSHSSLLLSQLSPILHHSGIYRDPASLEV
jgi:hypothetical protein